MMAETVAKPELAELIGELLLDLGDAAGADRLFGAVFRAREQGEPLPGRREGAERWEDVLRAALMGPDELRGQDD